MKQRDNEFRRLDSIITRDYDPIYPHLFAPYPNRCQQQQQKRNRKGRFRIIAVNILGKLFTLLIHSLIHLSISSPFRHHLNFNSLSDVVHTVTSSIGA